MCTKIFLESVDKENPIGRLFFIPQPDKQIFHSLKIDQSSKTMKRIRGILMNYNGKTINQELADKIVAEIYSLFEQQDDCYICSTNLGKDCPEGYGCGECCELGFYCDECAENQKFVCCTCGRKLV
jgi:hypothetical protein